MNRILLISCIFSLAACASTHPAPPTASVPASQPQWPIELVIPELKLRNGAEIYPETLVRGPTVIHLRAHLEANANDPLRSHVIVDAADFVPPHLSQATYHHTSSSPQGADGVVLQVDADYSQLQLELGTLDGFRFLGQPDSNGLVEVEFGIRARLDCNSLINVKDQLTFAHDAASSQPPHTFTTSGRVGGAESPTIPIARMKARPPRGFETNKWYMNSDLTPLPNPNHNGS